MHLCNFGSFKKHLIANHTFPKIVNTNMSKKQAQGNFTTNIFSTLFNRFFRFQKSPYFVTMHLLYLLESSPITLDKFQKLNCTNWIELRSACCTL